MDEYTKLRDIDSGIDRTNEYLYDIRALLTEIRDFLKPAQIVVEPPPSLGVSTEGAIWAMEGAHG